MAISLIAGALFWPTVKLFLDPVPYQDVTLISSEWKGDELRVQYSFVKNNGCELIQFATVGIGVVNDYLKYKDNGNLPPELFNREAGRHGLDITIYTEDFYSVEIRTSHMCDGERIDKVFAKETKPYGKT